ncbi:MAG: DegT/DnrJ/EryC1/StrS family aminotransferase [Candidatus Anstonellaceae archaeon]
MSELIRKKIIEYVIEYAKEIKQNIPKNRLPVSGKVFDEEELKNAVEAVLDCWWTEGRWNLEFEKKLREYLNLKFALTVNSGSSANLIAFYTLTSKKLGKKNTKRR